MALRVNRGAFARTCGLLLGSLAAICHACDPETMGITPPVDAGVDQAAAIVVPAADANADAAVGEDACERVLEPEAGCVHPGVVQDCDAGWCRIPHGCFIMGSPPCEFGRGLYDEDQVQVTLTRDFEIQQTEMTQAQWVALGFPNPSRQIEAGTPVNEGGTPVDISYGDCLEPTCPVGNVAVEEAMAAANKLSEEAGLPPCYALSGCSGTVGVGFACASRALMNATAYECLGYRLPTEAEWEYAARAGTQTAFYDGEIRAIDGCASDPVMDRIGWYCFNSGNYSHPVAQKKQNAWGLFDVAGNAAEWTSSDYTGAGLGTSPMKDPMERVGTGCIVTRGGLANSIAELGRPANRSLCVRGTGRGPLGGFRLVRTLQ
jgi:formylglycine-generating enzyme